MLELMINKKNYWPFIKYAMSTCTSFSIMLEKDDIDSSKYIFHDFYYSINEFIINKKSIYEHPDTGSHFSDCDLINIQCCETTRRVLMKATQIVDWNGSDYPEELCFYRNDDNWFAYIYHEGLLFIYNESKEDIDFLNKEGMEYYFTI